MTCPSCQAPLQAGSRFCGACGKASAATETLGEDRSLILSSPPEMAGREIAGRYRIVSKLGEGGMGAVFRAEQISLKRAVAIKLLRPEMSSNEQLLRRFNAEAELVAKLSHPNTVNIYDFGQDSDGSLFIAMELIEGRSLRHVLRDAGALPPARALAIAAQLASSLSDAHAHGIIHRDLKPDNVMLQDRGKERDIVRVLDFGIAKLRDDSRATQQAMTAAGDMLGTPQYMAPEQIRGETIDGRTDVYALGCILYEMLTARMPFEAPTVMAMLSKHLMEPVVPPSQRRPELSLSPALDQLVLAGVAKAPSARPPSMEAYGEHITAMLRTYQPVDSGLRHAAGPAIAPMGYAGFEERPEAPPPPLPPVLPPPSIPMGYAGAGMTGPNSGGLAAARAAAGPTEMVDPLPRPVLMRGPNGMLVTTTLPPHHARGGHGKTIAISVIGVVVMLGLVGGVAAWRQAQERHAPARIEDPKRDPDDDDHDKPDPPSFDPWGDHKDKDDDPSPIRDHELPTNEMPLPSGAAIHPSGAVQVLDAPGAIHFVDRVHGTDYLMAPMMGGANDPETLAAMYTAQHPGFEMANTSRVFSLGEMRDAVAFKGTVSTPNGPVLVGQIFVLYVTHSYRVTVMVEVPGIMFVKDKSFMTQLDQFFRTGIELPDAK